MVPGRETNGGVGDKKPWLTFFVLDGGDEPKVVEGRLEREWVQWARLADWLAVSSSAG